MPSRLLLRLLLTCSFALGLASTAPAQVLYENGPINGNTDAWTINFGYVVSNSFTISGGDSTITGMSFGAWLFPGVPNDLSVEVSLTSDEFGGTTYFDQSVSFTNSNCSMNGFGYNVCTETTTFNGPTLPNGTYWMNLQNAAVDSGDPVYWDENSGIGCHSPGCPSEASSNTEGTLPSEAFTLLGTTTGTGTVPEPGSLMLFSGGVVVAGGILRRKLC